MTKYEYYNMVRDSFEKAYDLYKDTNIDADLDEAHRIAQDLINIDAIRNNMMIKG